MCTPTGKEKTWNKITGGREQRKNLKITRVGDTESQREGRGRSGESSPILVVHAWKICGKAS